MERAAFIAYKNQVRKKVNDFYELCKFYSDVWNAASEKKVHPHRFMRDCKKNRRAYELAQIDYRELLQPHYKPNERARLLFGKLKVRKGQLNESSM